MESQGIYSSTHPLLSTSPLHPSPHSSTYWSVSKPAGQTHTPSQPFPAPLPHPPLSLSLTLTGTRFFPTRPDSQCRAEVCGIGQDSWKPIPFGMGSSRTFPALPQCITRKWGAHTYTHTHTPSALPLALTRHQN